MNTRIGLFTALFFIGLLMLTSCQKEAEEIIDPPSDQAFITGYVVSDLMQLTTVSDGSYDNILDKASCTSVVLPVTVIINGEEININSTEDFKKIKDAFDESEEEDEHDLAFIFPIELKLQDHSKVTIQNAAELQNFTKDCVENGDDDDIECIDFKYPMSFSIYNKDKEIAEVITFKNDEELYRFLENLDESDLVSIDFPVTMILSDGSDSEVNSNTELEDLIESSKDDCDENDHAEYEDDDHEDSALISTLVTGEWIIGYFSNDGVETSVFDGYKFVFNKDGTALADNGNKQISGTWQSKSEDDEKINLVLKFGETSPFVMLEDDWNVIEFDAGVIKLSEEDKVEESKRLLNFERP